MVLSMILAAAIGLAPTLPKDVPDVNSWEVVYGGLLSRTMWMDAVRPGGMTIKFLQTRGICPESEGADCAYLVRYRYRRNVVERKLVSFVQQYAVVGPTGVSAQGVSYYRYTMRGNIPVPTFDFYFLKGDRWLSEEPGSEEYLTAGHFFRMLSDQHLGK